MRNLALQSEQWKTLATTGDGDDDTGECVVDLCRTHETGGGDDDDDDSVFVLTNRGRVARASALAATANENTTIHTNNNNNSPMESFHTLSSHQLHDHRNRRRQRRDVAVDLNCVVRLSSADRKEMDHGSNSENTGTAADWFQLTYLLDSNVLVALDRASGAILAIPLAVLERKEREEEEATNDDTNGSSATTVEDADGPAYAAQTTVLDTEEEWCVGAFAHGIAAAAWNPDRTLLALVVFTILEEEEEETPATDATPTIPLIIKQSVLLCMNCEWDVLAEVTIPTIDSAYEVTLAWSPTSSLNNGNSNSSSAARQRIVVSSVGVVDDSASSSTSKEQHHCRVLNFYDGRTLEWQGSGRAQDGSGTLAPLPVHQAPVAWAPNNALLAAIGASKSGKGKSNLDLQVCFFEPNGLRHGEFSLRNQNKNHNSNPGVALPWLPWRVTSLAWNRDSDLLAVVSTEVNDDDQSPPPVGVTVSPPLLLTSRVQLWYRYNYHWYLKYERCFECNNNNNILNDEDTEISDDPWFGDMAHTAKFHESDPTRLCIFLTSSSYSNASKSRQGRRRRHWMEVKFQWNASTILYAPLGTASTATTIAYAVDGCNLNWTNLEQAVVPPPMYSSTLTLPAPVCAVAMARNGMTPLNSQMAPESLLCGVLLLSNGCAVVLHHGNYYNKMEKLSIAAVLKINNAEGFDVRSLRHLTAVQQETNSSLRLLAVATSWGLPEKDILVEIAVTAEDVDCVGSHSLEGRCLTISAWSDSLYGALIQLEDGSLFEYEVCGFAQDNGIDSEAGASTLSPSPADSLLEPCPWLAAVRNVGDLAMNTNHVRLIVGMSPRFRLYCNDFLVADSISSFSLSMENQFLCFATYESRCVLRFISLVDLANFDTLQGSDEHHILEGYEPRNIERGGRLVAVLSGKPSAVLQMPRGNLEVVFPRALVLRHAMMKIHDKQFKEAFELVRRHKVDPNLIVDMNPVDFLDGGGAKLFIEQIHNVEYLNLFISCLQNSNVTEERYPIPNWIQSFKSILDEEVPHFDFSTKLNRVCDVIRRLMMEMEENGQTECGRSIEEGHFLLPVLSTFAKEDPPQLENALQLIKDAASRKQTIAVKKHPLLTDAAQNSIQYLAFLADYELLFETSLGMYDFDLARAVARNSQMDPKSYLPMLQRYRSLPLYFGRFQVDVSLKRYESALKNLSQSGIEGEIISEANRSESDFSTGNDFDSCMQLIDMHQLHRLGLTIFATEVQRNRIMLSLGDLLMTTKQEENALLIYLTTKPNDENRCARAASETRQWAVLFSLPSINGDDLKTQTLARKIADDLVTSSEGNFRRREILAQASRVLLDYAHDIVGAVDMLVRAESWLEAKRIGLLHSRNDLAKRVVTAAVAFAHTTAVDNEERGNAFVTAYERYTVVLKIRKAAIVSDGNSLELENAHDDSGSLFSSASQASNLSLRSTTSSSSVGSLSSVISARSTSSFSLTGEADAYRHKSKFNQLGRNKPVKKKKKSKSSKIRPGSEDELNGLVQTLTSNCTDATYSLVVGDTICFLVQNGQLDVARTLFDSYIGLCQSVTSSLEEPLKLQQTSLSEVRIVHAVEAEVNALSCFSLPQTIHEIFALIPAW